MLKIEHEHLLLVVECNAHSIRLLSTQNYNFSEKQEVLWKNRSKCLSPSTSILPFGATVSGAAFDDTAFSAERTGLADDGIGVHHCGDDFGDHLLKLLEKLAGFVFLLLNFTELLFPDTGELGAFQKVFVDKADEFDACGRRL